MDYRYILKIVKGECTPEEKESFFKQVSEDKLLEQEYVRIKNEYTLQSLPYIPDSTVSLNQKKNNSGFITWLTRIAAILFIPLMAYFVYSMFTREHVTKNEAEHLYKSGAGVQYAVNKGVKASLILPDSTKVWLNSGSLLKIPNDFSTKKRTVSLSGEAYFDVKPDSTSPFIINTSKDIMVRVTGTQFNLSCYDNDENMKVTLLTGALQVIPKNKNAIMIKRAEQVVIQYSSLQNKLNTHADTEYATAWKQGFLRFNNTPLDEVIRKLERWYGVNITIDSKTISDYNFTADFESESIIQVLELLKITTSISYSIEGNTIALSENK